MSEYQKRKDEALRLQREKEEQLTRELAEKAEKEKQRARDEAEKKRQRDAAAAEARRKELAKANEALQAGSGWNGDENEWDMFADDERPKVTLATTTNTLIKTHGQPRVPNGGTTPNAKAGPSKPRASGARSSNGTATNGRSKDGSSPPPLGRLEKRAKAFAQQAMKGGKNESIFSVRSLVESVDGPASGPVSPRPKSNGSGKQASASVPKNGLGRAGVGVGALKGGNFKAQLNKSLKGEEMRKLCPDRETRDRRTIDEIQKDIKSRKKANVPDPPTRVKPKPAPIPSTARSISTVRRQRSPSSSSTSTYESDRPRKRNKAGPYELSQAQVSAEIQALFRRPGMPQRKYVDEISDDGSSDMEAGLSDVEMEERRTAAIARREDELAEREERERKLAKERAKRERAGGGRV